MCNKVEICEAALKKEERFLNERLHLLTGSEDIQEHLLMNLLF